MRGGLMMEFSRAREERSDESDVGGDELSGGWRINATDQMRITKYHCVTALVSLQPQDPHAAENTAHFYCGNVSVRKAPRYFTRPQGDNFSISELPPDASQPVEDVTNKHGCRNQGSRCPNIFTPRADRYARRLNHIREERWEHEGEQDYEQAVYQSE